MAQRLLRRLCEKCKKETVVEGNILQAVEEVIVTIEDKSLVPKDRSRIWVAGGCPACNNTGYKGRIGIYEAILMDEKIEKVVQAGASDREIWETAKSQGILTMKQDGILKILAGVTSIDELERVISLQD